MKITLTFFTLAIACIVTFFSFNSEDEQNINNQYNNQKPKTAQIIETPSPSRDTEGDTFSIVAYDPITGEFGGAGTSCVDNYNIDFLNQIIVNNNGDMIGAINAQAAARTQNATNAKNRMLAGDSPQEIIDWLDANDCCTGGSAARQYGIVGFDSSGNLQTAGFTGSNNGVYGNHITGPNYSIQGNILDVVIGQKILESMEAGFLETEGSLADKLMAALQGAKRVGADKRCGVDAVSSDGPYLPNAYTSGLASFIRVRQLGDTGVSNNVGTNNYLDLTLALNSSTDNLIEPIDVLQCSFDTFMGNSGFFCRDTVDTFPYIMDFETRTWEEEASCGVANAWIRSKFSTPSGNTGPDGANQGSMYTYFESTDIGNGLGTTGYIASPCFVVPADRVAAINFDYHMYSNSTTAMGTLSLEANDDSGSGWTTVWSKSGNQGQLWQNDGFVRLTDYVGTTVKLRFKASASADFTNDFALDNINIELQCVDTAIYDNGWSNGDISDSSTSTIIRSNYTTSIGDITACELTVTNNATLTIMANTFAQVAGNITIDAGSTLIIEHQGNVVQLKEDAQVINNGTINVELTTPALNARDFMLLGSPMTGDDNTTFTSAYQVLKHTTENFEPYTPSNGDPAIEGENFMDQDINDFTPHTGALNPGEGYFVRPSYTQNGTYNYTFAQGTLNTGPITYNAFFGDDKQDSPSIISNPYASAIDAVKFINDNDVVSEIYYWNHLTTPSSEIPGPNVQNFSMEDVSMFNGTMGIQAGNGGAIPNGVIATGQGFGIKANNANGGDVVFNNSMRLTGGNDVLKTPTQNNKDLMWITVSEDEFQLGSTTGLGFLDNATSAFDDGFDAARLGTVVGLYSHLEFNNSALAIQAREAFNNEMEISLGFSSLIELDNHQYTIKLSKLEGSNIEAATVYLRDNLLNTITNLSEENYTFNAAAGTQNNRFTILFNDDAEVLDTTSFNANAINVFPNPSSNIITIASPVAAIINVRLYDLQGREVSNIVSQDDKQYVLDVSSLNAAIYYLTVVTDKGTLTKKIIKK